MNQVISAMNNICQCVSVYVCLHIYLDMLDLERSTKIFLCPFRATRKFNDFCCCVNFCSFSFTQFTCLLLKLCTCTCVYLTVLVCVSLLCSF